MSLLKTPEVTPVARGTIHVRHIRLAERGAA
jgi:hypothetical protein